MAEVVSVNISEKKGAVKREVPEIHRGNGLPRRISPCTPL